MPSSCSPRHASALLHLPTRMDNEYDVADSAVLAPARKLASLVGLAVLLMAWGFGGLVCGRPSTRQRSYLATGGLFTGAQTHTLRSAIDRPWPRLLHPGLHTFTCSILSLLPRFADQQSTAIRPGLHAPCRYDRRPLRAECCSRCRWTARRCSYQRSPEIGRSGRVKQFHHQCRKRS